MNNFEIFFYFVCFAIINECTKWMMWSNIQSINVEMNKPKPRHPEAPEFGEEVMYVDLTKEKLESFTKKMKIDRLRGVNHYPLFL